MPSSILSVYTTFMGNACENKTNSTFSPLIIILQFLHVWVYGSENFLKTICNLSFNISGTPMLSRLWVRRLKKKRVNKFICKHSNCFGSRPMSIAYHWPREQERGSMLLGPLLMVQLRVCCAFHLWIIIWSILPIMCIL